MVTDTGPEMIDEPSQPTSPADSSLKPPRLDEASAKASALVYQPIWPRCTTLRRIWDGRENWFAKEERLCCFHHQF